MQRTKKALQFLLSPAFRGYIDANANMEATKPEGASLVRQPIVRQPPRDNLCTTNDGEAIEHLHGDVVVWWYERQRKNHDAETIPYVDIIFRYLDRYDVPAGQTIASIGISKLSSFRIGTIWRNGKCIGETHFGPEQIFSVDFTFGAWSYRSFQDSADRNQPLPISNKDYPFRYDKTEANILDFALPKRKNLLVPCVEFLARCYGSTSDIPRILATYPWHDVMERLYASPKKDPDRWVVRPHHKISDADGLLLASLLYDGYAIRGAREIYSQLDNAWGAGLNHASLRVQPWFQGLGKIACRGLWINGGKTFLCLEVTGMSQPHANPYEIKRAKYSKEDLLFGDIVIIPVKPAKLPVEQDPFEVTDRIEPDRNANTHVKKDPGFQIIGDQCPFVKTTEELLFSEKNVVPVAPNQKEKYSTGDGNGGENSVDRIIFNAERFVGNGGIVNEMWVELNRLQNKLKVISGLAWCNEGDIFVTDYNFKIKTLPELPVKSPLPNELRRWLSLPTNPNRRRGMLITRFMINERSFYLFEIQRKKVRNGSELKEEQFYGLILELNNAIEATIEIDRICDRIRFHKGKFKKLHTIKKYSHHVFRHIKNGEIFSAETTVRNALKNLGVQLMVHKSETSIS